MAGKTFSFNTFQVKQRQLIESNLQTFNCAIFPMVAVSLDGKMVNVCVCIPISTPTLSGISQFFSGKKVTAPPKSEGARTPMQPGSCNQALSTALHYAGIHGTKKHCKRLYRAGFSLSEILPNRKLRNRNFLPSASVFKQCKNQLLSTLKLKILKSCFLPIPP